MTRYAVLVLTSGLLVSPLVSAVGQTPNTSAARMALERSAAGDGLTLLQPITIDTLGEDEYTELTFDVKADVDVIIRAACDIACNEMDLKVFDAAGAALDEDTSGSAAPQVLLVAGHHPTRINVLADLVSCDNKTCSVAVGAYKR